MRYPLKNGVPHKEHDGWLYADDEWVKPEPSPRITVVFHEKDSPARPVWIVVVVLYVVTATIVAPAFIPAIMRMLR